MSDLKVGIVGSGLVGKSWAMIFASAGYTVKMFDVNEDLAKKAIQDIREQIDIFGKSGHLRGKLSVEEQKAKISSASTLEECLNGAVYVQVLNSNTIN